MKSFVFYGISPLLNLLVQYTQSIILCKGRALSVVFRREMFEVSNTAQIFIGKPYRCYQAWHFHTKTVGLYVVRISDASNLIDRYCSSHSIKSPAVKWKVQFKDCAKATCQQRSGYVRVVEKRRKKKKKMSLIDCKMVVCGVPEKISVARQM